MPAVDHFAFEVSDMGRAIRFYTEKLGLKLLSSDLDKAHHEVYAFLELDGGNLELLQTLDENNNPIPRAAREPAPSCCPHLALKTDDMAACLANLRRQGIPILKGPLEIPGEIKWVYVTDPDNNVLEFIQWL